MTARSGSASSQRAFALFGGAVLAWVQLMAGCGQAVEVGRDDPLSLGGSAGSAGSGGGSLLLGGSPTVDDGGRPTAQAGAPPCTPIECRGKKYECGNCEDDDGDGSIDALDSACLGPCDDDEAGLSSGMVTSQASSCRQDCYFDGDNGAGNDSCEWSHACDELSVAPDFPPSGDMRCEYDGSGPAMGVDCEARSAEQAPTCLENCLPLVPNGCDCFGCCALPDGKYHFIGRGRGELGCQLEALDDEQACPTCTPVESCFNPCDLCEVCVGKELGPGCDPGDACPPGQAECATDATCDVGRWCLTGCCVRSPEPI